MVKMWYKTMFNIISSQAGLSLSDENQNKKDACLFVEKMAVPVYVPSDSPYRKIVVWSRFAKY